MKFTRKTKSYEIDLSLPEKRRWNEVIKKELPIARRVYKEASEYFDDVPWYLACLKGPISNLYERYGGLYYDEMESWARKLGCKPKEFLMLQCAYEVNHAQNAWINSSIPEKAGDIAGKVKDVIFDTLASISPFCTAGIVQSKKFGMLHFRTLDWEMKQIGRATRLFHFKTPTHTFTAVGIVGLLGVLSGMVPGKYSVTINFAPVDSLPSVGRMGCLFHLRDVLETCSEYADAVRALSNTELSSNVFFTVCGAQRGQGCIIERTQTDKSVRKFTKGALVQANHFNSSKFRYLNAHIRDDDDVYSLFDSSIDRQKELTKNLSRLHKIDRIEDCFEAFKGEYVSNSDTEQRMIFCPGSGDICVERRKR